MLAQEVKIEDLSGKLLDPVQSQRDQETIAKANIKRQNNILELDLLI